MLKQLRNAYSQSFRSIENDLIKLFENMNEITLHDAMRYNRLTSLKKQIRERLSGTGVKLFSIIDKERVREFESSYAQALNEVRKDLPNPQQFSKLPIGSVEAVINEPWSGFTLKELLKNDSDKAFSQITGTITRGIIEGKGLVKVTKDLQAIEGMTKRRARTIALTETLRARSQGKQELVERLEGDGFEIEKIWKHNPGASRTEPRPFHASMNGVESVDGEFTMDDGVTMKAPRLTSSARHGINCHCSVKIKIIDGDND